MQVDVVRPQELGIGDLARWQGLQAGDTSLDSPFLCPEFSIAVAAVRPSARLAVFSDGAGGTGYLPFERGRLGGGSAIGIGLSDVQGIVAPAGSDVDLNAVLRAAGIGLFHFDHWLAAQEPWLSALPSRLVGETSPALDLSHGFDQYLDERQASSKSLLQSTARKRRKLEREHGPVMLAFHEADHSLLDLVLDWKSRQYRRTGRRDRFADHGNRALVHALLDADGPSFGATLSVLRAGDSVVAAHLGLRSRSTLAWWFPVYDPRFSAYSPGLVFLLDLARAMTDRHLTLLDLGKGDEPYKERLGNRPIQLLRGTVARYRVQQAIHTVGRWPSERAMQAVLGSPRLRHAGRTTLGVGGALRERLSRPRA